MDIKYCFEFLTHGFLLSWLIYNLLTRSWIQWSRISSPTLIKAALGWWWCPVYDEVSGSPHYPHHILLFLSLKVATFFHSQKIENGMVCYISVEEIMPTNNTGILDYIYWNIKTLWILATFVPTCQDTYSKLDTQLSTLKISNFALRWAASRSCRCCTHRTGCWG